MKMQPHLLEMTQEILPNGLVRTNCTFFVGNFRVILPEYFGKPKGEEFFKKECIKLIKKSAKEL